MRVCSLLADLTPRLPVELLYEIMTSVAKQSRQTALVLTLVCKTANAWVTSIIYRTITLNRNIHEIHRTITDAESRLKSHVRNLSLFDLLDSPLARKDDSLLLIRDGHINRERKKDFEILVQCTHIERLVMEDCWHPFKEEMSTITVWPQPWEVILVYNHQSCEKWSKLPFFQNITHFYYGDLDFALKGLCPAMSQLTHLGFRWYTDFEADDAYDIVEDFLSRTNPSPEALCIDACDLPYTPIDKFLGPTWIELAQIEDERLFLRPGLAELDFVALLEREESIWDNLKEKYGGWRDLVREHNEVSESDWYSDL